MGERIKLKASDGFVFNGYRAAPAGTPKGGVVVIQEVWGLNRWTRSEVDRYAAAGYVCVAPATMDRVEKVHPSKPHWYLQVIGTDPAKQGMFPIHKSRPFRRAKNHEGKPRRP